MNGTLLWLVAFLASTLFTFLADGAPLHVMSAPNLLRVGTPENIFVECQDCTGGDITVEIIVLNHPTKKMRLASTTVTLTWTKNFQELAQIMIPAREFRKDPNVKQYVYLQAQFPDRLLEKVVLVSLQSGYIFIQTDKTIYTPNSKVLYRIFAVTPSMKPIGRDDTTQTDASIDIEIVTPEGTIFSFGPFSLKSGIHSGDYQLGEIVSPGLWKVVAKFYRNQQQSYSAEFEVREYVLPSFEVKLEPQSPFFYLDSEELIVNIRATYLFGEEVNGMAYVVFGVIQNGHKRGFPSSLQRVQVVSGYGEVTLKREHITGTFPEILRLVGGSIYVAVSVLTENGGEMVETELRNVPIVISPYTIHFKRTPKYYKPGMSFDVTVEVVNPDDTPAEGVPVVVNPGEVRGLTAANGIASLTINTVSGTERLTITAKTENLHLTPERQASANMVALPYLTKSSSYLHIGVDTSELKLGDNLKITLNLNRQLNQNEDITYLIQSRGQLVKYYRFKTRGQVLIYQIVPITKEMLPSFRIVAYYHTDDNEVVSDAVWVDVEDDCMGSLRLESSRPARSYEPRRMFGLKVTGDPEARVGLLAVDKDAYVLNNKHRLTQKKVWDVLEKSDTGCTPGGGKDSMSVFYDAGLLFESTASGTPYRQDSRCPAHTRRKREEDYSYMGSDEIVSRTKFPESWLFADIRLPSCSPQRPNCDTTSIVKHIPLQDSVTTWEFLGISLSRTYGICVAKPLEVVVRKEFFIDLRLPYSAVRGEQLEIKAILHNYSPDPITVRVDLFEEKDVCSAASKRGKYRQEIVVEAETSRSVPFIIIPIKTGQHRIRVKAAVRNSVLNDGIMKSLQVVPEGILIKSPKTLKLAPAMKGVGGRQQEVINSDIPLKDLVPNTPVSTIISLTGREPINAPVETAISGNSMDNLIYEPSGDGETNMIHMTLPVIATTYLDETNQWETVGFQKRNKALEHIKTGYGTQLLYLKRDGSFAGPISDQSSTWLTAYVAKVFTMVTNLVIIYNRVICDAVKFLILNAQQPNGLFIEIGRVMHREMMGDVGGTDSDASMTAFCLIAMQESRRICSDTVNMLSGSIDKAVTYLETRLPHLTNPYAVAMTSYALANEYRLNKEILYNFVSPELSHWPVPKGHIYTLEATAYALLALVKARAFEEARPVFRWFSQQQKVGGGYGSTQATIMVYQAVAEYWTTAGKPEYDVDVDILLPDRSTPVKYNFHHDNYFATRTLKFASINQNVTVIATGSGEATLNMASLYYALPKERNSPKFNLSVQLLPVTMNEDENIYKLRIEVLFMDRERDASMSILDINLLTGFTVNTDDLNLLSRGHARTIANYDMHTVLSRRGSLIIYLDKVSHTRPEEITFRIHQTIRVGVLQPAAVSVYEYYDQTPSVKFYHPGRNYGELRSFCSYGECTCAEEACSVQKKGPISSEERKAKVGETSLIDFAYKVRVVSFTDSLPSDTYTVRIDEVIMERRNGESLLGKMLNFLSPKHCREALALKTGKNYLIMGTSRRISEDKESHSYKFALGEKTWIEYWPTSADCWMEEHRPTCLGLEELVRHAIFQCLDKSTGLLVQC